MIDVIVPTIPEREQSLERLVRSLHKTPDLNIVTIDGSPTCGAGWLDGIERTSGDYVLLACDDQEFLGAEWPAICMATVDHDNLPCPRVWTPQMHIESQGGDMDSLHHVIARPQKDRTFVDYTTVPFMSRKMAEQIGMIPVHYCSDVWVSYRGRQLGYETILRHGFDVRHHKEAAGRGAGMTVLERDATDERRMREELVACAS